MVHRTGLQLSTLALASAAILLAPPAAAQTRTLLVASDHPAASVSPTCGDADTPCAKIQLAVNQATDDTVINVRPNASGYAGFYAVGAYGARAQRVVVRSEPGTNAVINRLVDLTLVPDVANPADALVLLEGTNHWSIEQLRFQIAGRSDIAAIGILPQRAPVVARARNVGITGCVIQVTCVGPSDCAPGIAFFGVDDVTIADNIISDAGGAVYGTAAANVRISHNRIVGATGFGIYLGGGEDEARMTWIDGNLTNVTVERNLVSRVQRTGTAMPGLPGRYLGIGLWMNDVTTGTIENNGLVDVAGVGLFLGNSPNLTTGIAVRHNTIVLDPNAVARDLFSVPVIAVEVERTAFSNNIFQPVENGRVYVIGAEDIDPNRANAFDYVGFSHASGDDVPDFATRVSAGMVPATAMSLSEWRGYGFDTHAINQPVREMVQFPGGSTRPYHLIAGSGAIDFGDPTAPPPPPGALDYEGTARQVGVAVDLGYDEYEPSAQGDGGAGDGGVRDGAGDGGANPVPDDLAIQGGSCAAPPGSPRGPSVALALLGAALASRGARRLARRRRGARLTALAPRT